MSDCRRFEDLSVEEVAEFRDKQRYFMIPKNMWMLVIHLSDEECGVILKRMFVYGYTGIIPELDNDSGNEGLSPEVEMVSCERGKSVGKMGE